MPNRTLRVKVSIDTDILQDAFVLACRDPEKLDVRWLLDAASKYYHDWHPFPVHEFQLRLTTNGDIVPPDQLLSAVGLRPGKGPLSCVVQETDASKQRRAREEELAKQESKRREEELEQKEKERAAKMAALKRSGGCRDFVMAHAVSHS